MQEPRFKTTKVDEEFGLDSGRTRTVEWIAVVYGDMPIEKARAIAEGEFRKRWPLEDGLIASEFGTSVYPLGNGKIFKVKGNFTDKRPANKCHA